jgi:histidine triad (HIT) family protein
VHEGERVIAFRDINPQAPTHVQVIPRTHVAHITDFDAGRDTPWLVELIQAANDIAAKEGLDKGFRLVINNGPLAGQSVFHVHLHLLGGRGLGWPPG